MLAGERLESVVAELGRSYRHVLIDAPAVLEHAEATLLGPVVDGIVLVIRAGRTDVEAVRAARDGLELVGARVLGVVINDPAHRRPASAGRLARLVTSRSVSRA